MKPLSVQALERVGKNWSVGKGTREAKLQTIKRFCQFAQKQFGLQRIENLKPGHVQAYAQSLHDQKLDSRTGANYMSHVRDLCQAIGKGGIVATDNAAYGFGGASRQNPMNVNCDKIAEIRLQLDAKAAAGDRVALMMSATAGMRDAFGLRQEEAMLSCRVVMRDGKPHLDVQGAKGGKPREVPVRNDKQVTALDKLAATAKALGNAQGRAIPPELSLNTAMNKESKEWNKMGGTRAAKANMHAQRHAYAQERLAEGATKAEVNRELGHGDHRSLGCYVPNE
ncbi:MAG: integrase domain-containing protein [Desulfobacteraceae bacterium]|nr:integrase domain-containing protein [Desulfobacteraceae bacterium]